MACVAVVYRPRDAEHTVLHQVIGAHLETFLRAAAEAGGGDGLPQFVEREFLECGYSSTASCGFAARAARASTWWRFPASGASVRVVAGGG
jgi:hypothetical protein